MYKLNIIKGKPYKMKTSFTFPSTGGTSNHNELSNLDYANSGHTGFQPTISDLNTIRTGANLGSTAIQPEVGKGLSTNDYTTEEKTKLSGIENGANKTTKTSDLQNDSGFIDSNYHDSTKQNVTDNTLATNNKTIPTAINELNTSILNLKNIGRFLAIWNATTGVPTSEPSTSPYSYKTGDYFRIGVVGNKIPNGSSYIIGGTNYTTTTETLNIGDVYYYDGTVWLRQASSGGGAVQDVQQDGVSVLNGGIANIDLSGKENIFRYATMPTADITNVNKIAQFIGTTDSIYTNGYFYKNIHTQIQESITATQTDNVVPLGTITLDNNTFKSMASAGTHEFYYRPYNTVLNFSNISVFPPTSYQVTRDNTFDIQPMIPNAPKLYSWVDNSNNFYATDTLQPNALTKLYLLDIQTNDLTDTGATFISSNTPSLIEGRWTKKEGDVYTDVEISDYGIYLTSAGIPGNTISVNYIEANDLYNWQQINVQPNHDIPSGGTTGQFLKKSSNTDYDSEWFTLPTVQMVVTLQDDSTQTYTIYGSVNS